MDKNKTIKCDAEKCRYHTPDDFCCADSINVGSPCACCSEETVCNTFAPESDN